MSYASHAQFTPAYTGSTATNHHRHANTLSNNTNAWYPTTVHHHQLEYSSNMSMNGGGYDAAASSAVRSRLDSGSFSASSSESTSAGRSINSSNSGNSRGGNSSNNNNSKRRSHRPRGCRGGGARRARKALREQARAANSVNHGGAAAAAAASENGGVADGASSGAVLAQQENVKPSSTLQANSKEYHYPPKYVMSEQEELQDQQQYQHKALERHGGATAPRGSSPVPSLQPCMSTLSNDSSSSDYFSIFMPAAPASTSNNKHYVDAQGRARTRVPYGTMTFTDDQRRATTKSAKDAVPNMSLTILNPIATPSTVGQHSDDASISDFVSVLPPPLVDNTAKESDRTLDGPNPYALKSNRVPYANADSFETVNPTVSASNSNASYPPQFEVTCTEHEERIEKQRNMLSGGGSLFVTSPRSFLMGRKQLIF